MGRKGYRWLRFLFPAPPPKVRVIQIVQTRGAEPESGRNSGAERRRWPWG